MAVMILSAVLVGFALALMARSVIKSAEAAQKARIAREERDRQEVELEEAKPKTRRRKGRS